MAKKAADLRDMLQDRAKPVPQSSFAAKDAAPQEKPYYRPSRANKRNVTGYFAPAVSKQLRRLALDRDMSVQALLAEALDDLFVKYHLPEIANADAKS